MTEPTTPPAGTTTFAADYTLNGAVLYPAGVPVPTTEHTAQLIADGVAGEATAA